MDADVWWGARTYRLMAKVAVSQVAGEPEAIRRLQRSSARYFQRPDREGSTDGFFSNGWATTLRGYGAYARLAKDAGDWLWEVSANLRSPGFETNDVGFLTAADYVWTSANLLRQFTTPTRYFRRLTLIAGGQQEVNYSGDLISRQLHAYAGAQLPNYWTVSGFYMRWPERDDDRLTRGGPVVRVPRGGHISFNLSTDERGSIVLGTNPNLPWRANGTRDYNVNLSLTYRPASNVSVRVGPGYSHRESATQYVDAWDDATAEAFGGRRYLFGDLRQRTVSMDTRLSVTFTPALSLELFAQPYISAARYSAFKEYEAPRTTRMRTYGEDFGTLTRTTDGYTVDPAGEAGGAAAYSFDDPDFNFRSLRGNAVLRWEYRPGSTLFLVWTQDRNDTAPTGDLRLDRDRQALFSAPADHIFQLKASYWLNP